MDLKMQSMLAKIYHNLLFLMYYILFQTCRFFRHAIMLQPSTYGGPPLAGLVIGGLRPSAGVGNVRPRVMLRSRKGHHRTKLAECPLTLKASRRLVAAKKVDFS